MFYVIIVNILFKDATEEMIIKTYLLNNMKVLFRSPEGLRLRMLQLALL